MIRSDWLLVLCTVGAVARLTRMVTEDVVFQPFRRFVIRHRPAPPPQGIDPYRIVDVPDQDEPRDEDWLVYLVHCRWCVSIWISAPMVAAVWAWPHQWWTQVPLIALTASLVAALIAGLEH